MADARESLGSLSTIVQRKTYTIASKATKKQYPNGKIYDVASPADFGPVEYAVLVEKQQIARELQARKRLTVAQKKRAQDALDDVVRLLIPKIESAVLAEMTEAQKANFVLTWIIAETPAIGGTPGNRKARRQPARKTQTSRRPTGSR